MKLTALEKFTLVSWALSLVLYLLYSLLTPGSPVWFSWMFLMAYTLSCAVVCTAVALWSIAFKALRKRHIYPVEYIFGVFSKAWSWMITDDRN